MGRALIGPLNGLQRAGVPVELNTAFTDLFVENGVVFVHVRDSHEAESAEPQLIRSPRRDPGPANEQMRIERTSGQPITEWTAGASATGDGILAAEKLGALDLMDDVIARRYRWDKPWFAPRSATLPVKRRTKIEPRLAVPSCHGRR